MFYKVIAVLLVIICGTLPLIYIDMQYSEVTVIETNDAAWIERRRASFGWERPYATGVHLLDGRMKFSLKEVAHYRLCGASRRGPVECTRWSEPSIWKE